MEVDLLLWMLILIWGMSVFFGAMLERFLFNTFSWVRIQNIRGKNKGVAFVFFRSQNHKHKLIDFNEKSFEVGSKTFCIDSTKAERMFGVPCLAYVEDNAEPVPLSRVGKEGDTSPEELQGYVRLVSLYLKAKEAEDWDRFKKFLLFAAGGIALFSLIILFGVWSNGAELLAAKTASQQAASTCKEVLTFITGV